jgi:hypothetical protein
MFLGISILGWIILAIAYLPVGAILMWIASKRGVRNTAFVVTAVLLSLPYAAAIAEAAYVEHKWRALCATAKTEVKRKVVVEGFYDDGFFYDGWTILKGSSQGFRFVEWKDKEGRIWRTEGFNEPELRTSQIDAPSARYRWHMDRFGTAAGHLLKRSEDTIVDVKTGEVIASHVAGARYPAFADRIWRQWFASSPEECGSKRVIWGETLVGIDRKADNK